MCVCVGFPHLRTHLLVGEEVSWQPLQEGGQGEGGFFLDVDDLEVLRGRAKEGVEELTLAELLIRQRFLSGVKISLTTQESQRMAKKS